MNTDYETQAPTSEPNAVSAVPAPAVAPAAEPAAPETAESTLSAPEADSEPASALRAETAKKKAPRLENVPTRPVRAQTEQKQSTPDHARMLVCDVQFRSGGKIYFFDPAGLELKNGDHVILDTSRGAEFGYCIIGNHKIARRELDQPLRRVLRLATPTDERVKEENTRKEKEAYAFCLRKVEELGLDMQLVSAELAFDGSKLLFFFTADARVDFRELVRILAANFHTRIELRQIGVRDKAKMLGGLGVCGRPFCCASFLDDFQPVSIKMAKTQNLSLNPTKISGTCGRLMCCLKYEQEAYEDLIKTSPKADSFVDTPDGRGTVTNVNLMRQSVSVRMEKDEGEIRSYRNCEICILRNGKPKKTDPPIPEDLAPISGRKEDGLIRERYSRLEQRLTAESAEQDSESVADTLRERRAAQDSPRRERNPELEGSRHAARDRRPEREPQAARHEASREKLERKPEQNRRRKSNRPAERAGESAERPERIEAAIKTESGEKSPPSRQQRRRRQQGKQDARHPQAEPQPRRSAPEKRQEDSTAPKPEGAKKNNHRRYYHNRKPKGE